VYLIESKLKPLCAASFVFLFLGRHPLSGKKAIFGGGGSFASPFCWESKKTTCKLIGICGWYLRDDRNGFLDLCVGGVVAFRSTIRSGEESNRPP
jgi:hypothetical protein